MARLSSAVIFSKTLRTASAPTLARGSMIRSGLVRGVRGRMTSPSPAVLRTGAPRSQRCVL
jgi:hypothetical protein